ncbi:nuclear transport factor 2 family protein [Pontibacter saemangeumensis]|uniref:Nuclear transport factor 2 family protein n=1 Tax=Pontibacter saemangeumensis TaxID=1084525 RepID=A0ABP8LMU5_9BACT
MKKCLFPFLLFLLLTVVACAQANDEKGVAAAVAKFNQAMVSADKSQLERLTAAELSYGHSSGNIQDKAAFVEDVVSGPFDFLTIDAADETITMAGNTAVVRHVFSSKATNNGTPTDIRIGVMQVWQKQRGEWKLLARQAYKL